MASSMNAYDIEHFESYSSAAPAKKSSEKKSDLKKVAPRSHEQLRAQELAGLKKSVSFLAFVAVVFGIILMQISAGAENYRLAREIQSVEAALEIQKSENVRLNSELNGITGIAIIDTYATEKLGMTKVENYQIECIDLSDGDTVIYSSNIFGK